MLKCQNCDNTLSFKVITIIQKVFSRTYDEDGDLVQEELDKSSVKKLETWLCAGCGSLADNQEPEDDIQQDSSPARFHDNQITKQKSNNKPKDRSQEKTKFEGKDKKKHKNIVEKPTEKQLKYLNDLADCLNIPQEEREGFSKLSKKEVSDKLTELYKECKKRGIEI